MRKKRQTTSINAGSMADIAFLLLIFFLVSTQILNDKGVRVLLPEYSEQLPESTPSNKKILKIMVNMDNALLVNSKLSNIEFLRTDVKRFILNPDLDSSLPSSPSRAIISIDSDDKTSYETYVRVYSEIKKAYVEMWSEYAIKTTGKAIDQLSKEEVKKIKNVIPLSISELEKRKIR